MIRLASLAGLIALLFAGAAHSNPIVVRSGDHEGFTRLVLRLPENVTWELIEEPGLKTISFRGHDAGFNVSRVFDVIPRDQLLEVRPYPSRLELDLSCVCDVNTFVERREFLVVDILDGPPLPPESTASAPRFITARPASGFNFGDLLWSDFASPDGEAIASNKSPAEQQPDAIDPSVEARESEAAFVEQTRQQLLAGLSNAASRGILEPATPDLNGVIGEEEMPPAEEIFDSSEEEIVVVAPEGGNIRITSSRDTPRGALDGDLMTSGAVCASPDRVMVPEWGGEDPFHLQVAGMRRALYSEVDRLNPDQAIALARLYIFFGFGAEAKEVLSLSGTLASEHPELMDLADIMEHGFARNPRFVHRFADCESELALWAAMAAQELPAEQILNEAAALRALAALPDHLRRFIAPALSKRLADSGSLDSASIALRNTDWTKTGNESDSDLAEATIEKQSGNTERAENLLSEVIEDNAAETPQAMIALVNSRLDEGKAISADVALLIETYAFEWRDSPIAQDLQRAHVIASAYSDQFDKAFEALENELVTADPDLLNELRSLIFSALSSNADDITFLDAFFAEFPTNASALSIVSVEATVSRLLELGFAAEAEAILADLPADRANDDLRLLHAEALIAMRQPEAALTVLGLVQSDLSVPLKARALSQLGDNKEAFSLFETLDAEQDAVRAAWLANEWTELVESDAPVFGQARVLSEEAIPPVAAEDGMLEMIGSAVEQSSSARTTLEEILGGLPVDP
ncbi:tetratricopeptide repeat protein [Roseobacter sinensis]|uniref:Lipoprotein n=1 Tax=Roseobacter sinensis TaxID=2931391 RepID=A0ABT3B8H9_9RHOB|nr:hypothetical protein [Roseobacter sp. WL0113]MCV3269878.1 hypothetical protein [Roseobacter sp. WL0113]